MRSAYALNKDRACAQHQLLRIRVTIVAASTPMPNLAILPANMAETELRRLGRACSGQDR